MRAVTELVTEKIDNAPPPVYKRIGAQAQNELLVRLCAMVKGECWEVNRGLRTVFRAVTRLRQVYEDRNFVLRVWGAGKTRIWRVE